MRDYWPLTNTESKSLSSTLIYLFKKDRAGGRKLKGSKSDASLVIIGGRKAQSNLYHFIIKISLLANNKEMIQNLTDN